MSYKKSFFGKHACDIAALFAGLLLCVFLFAAAPYGAGLGDEALYCAIPLRFLAGDAPITEEWHLSQLFGLINVPLCAVYTRLAGSAEGIILFIRYVYSAAAAAIYGFIYGKLRRFGAAGITAAFLFCAMIPQTMQAFSYITLSVWFIMLALLILVFDGQRKNAGKYLLGGAVFALGVLAEPLLAVLYVCWAAAAGIFALRRRRHPEARGRYFLLEPRVFLPVTAGCAILFAAFMAILCAAGSLRALNETLPYLFTGKDYNVSNLIDLSKLRQAATACGLPWITGLALCLIAAAVTGRFFRDRRMAVRVVFLLSAVFLASCLAHWFAVKTPFTGVNVYLFLQKHDFPLLLFAPIPFLLCNKKDPRLTAMLAVGYGFSLLVDISSRTYLGSGGFLIRVPLLLQLSVFLKEQRSAPAEKPREKTKAAAALRALRAAGAVTGVICAAAVLLWDLNYISAAGPRKLPEQAVLHTSEPMEYTLTAGPLKNVKTTASIGRQYEKTLADLERIDAGKEGAFAVLDAAPFTYLYTNRPCGAFSVWYETPEPERLYAYWRMPHTEIPAYLYWPYYANGLFYPRSDAVLREQMEDLSAFIDFDCEPGEAGYILTVRALKQK